MHIAEGVLSGPVVGAGAALTVAGMAAGLRQMDMDRVPRVAVLASTFFVASLVHVPAGWSSAHLLLNGLTGLILGWAAFPAIFVALLLQALLFNFGGLSTLGVNTADMAIPAVVCGIVFGHAIHTAPIRWTFLLGFVCGSLAIVLAGLLTATALTLSGKGFRTAAELILAAHVPIAIIEGLVTGAVATFIRRVRPELFERPPWRQES
ncbi:MAG: cobalt transporter CbiM [Kiritimatiellaeota bacterium]|nr:cobalt transporter CbiM [Kiritimatiellota bacterium]